MQPYLDALAQGDWASGAVVLFALFIGHAICDHPLQGEFLALHKSRHHRSEGQTATIWPWCLASHSLIHAGAVWIVTGCPTLAAIELVAHAVIDFLKAENLTNIHIDQLLHGLCKVAYVMAIALG